MVSTGPIATRAAPLLQHGVSKVRRRGETRSPLAKNQRGMVFSGFADGIYGQVSCAVPKRCPRSIGHDMSNPHKCRSTLSHAVLVDHCARVDAASVTGLSTLIILCRG